MTPSICKTLSFFNLQALYNSSNIFSSFVISPLVIEVKTALCNFLSEKTNTLSKDLSKFVVFVSKLHLNFPEVISSTPVFEAIGRHDTSAKLAQEQKNISEQHAAASGQMIDDWNDMSRVQETWIEDIEDFSDQTRYATHLAFEGIDSMAPQAHAYRNIFGENEYTQHYYDFESDLMKNSQNVRLRMTTALNQMPDYFLKMQRMYF